MRILQADADGNARLLGSISETTIADIQAQKGVLWLDFSREDDREAVGQLLANIFGFHPLAIDDALHETHIPKIDDWEGYLYLVLQDASYVAETRRLRLPEVDVFLGQRFLVTYHKGATTAIDRVWAICQRDARWLQHGSDHLLYRLLDEIANNYRLIIEHLEDDLAEMESTIFTNPAPELLEQLFAFKRTTLRLRRVLAPQREVVNRLARDPYPLIGPKDQVFFRDVYDHFWRLNDLSDNLRDLVLGSMDIYLSVVNNQMNDVMRTLTVITTLFMPLTVLTGFFGMNFFQAVEPSPFWTDGTMLTFVLLIMLLLPFVMFLWMRRRVWTAP